MLTSSQVSCDALACAYHHLVMREIHILNRVLKSLPFFGPYFRKHMYSGGTFEFFNKLRHMMTVNSKG